MRENFILTSGGSCIGAIMQEAGKRRHSGIVRGRFPGYVFRLAAWFLSHS
jgi:hypothetical protein